MTDIDAPARYAEPAADRTGREGNVGLVVALALGLAVAAVALAMISREMAEPFVLAILGGLAVVGVFCLFAGAVGTTMETNKEANMVVFSGNTAKEFTLDWVGNLEGGWTGVTGVQIVAVP